MRFKLSSFLLCACLMAGCRMNRPSVEVEPQESEQTVAETAGQPQAGSAELTATLHVRGLSCPLCANNVEKQLHRVAGIRSVSVNLGTGEVRARLEPSHPPTREQLRRAIEKSGFTLVRIDMPKP